MPVPGAENQDSLTAMRTPTVHSEHRDDYTAAVGAILGVYRRHRDTTRPDAPDGPLAAPTSTQDRRGERELRPSSLVQLAAACARARVAPVWVLAAADGLTARDLLAAARALPVPREQVAGTPPAVAVGAMLSATRSACGVSSGKVLAARLGVSHEALYKWERGTTEIPLPRLRAYCRGLGVPVSAVVAAATTGSSRAPEGGYLLDLTHPHTDPAPDYARMRGAATVLREQGLTVLEVDDRTVAALATATGIDRTALRERLDGYPLTLPLGVPSRPSGY
ncbi:helix-turn-helix transcriptional regulator [Actinokineospora auranticolor]|uniref:Helix-turn-helix protein n=1 Tax=Actinokineospora auranticolor TaxID=155976 RepID=A0A2S6GLY9_9PSEU|nr:helix-turn-helix transcriptional regulator [Actinokineospora auranticolor]PPK66200.1 helix-turn-helix protein [Actinokineospora auranticolor]